MHTPCRDGLLQYKFSSAALDIGNPAQGGGQDRSVHGTSGEAARAVDASGPAPTPRAGLPFPHARC